MKGNGKGGEQDKGAGKGFWEGAKRSWASGKNNSKGRKGSGKQSSDKMSSTVGHGFRGGFD